MQTAEVKLVGPQFMSVDRSGASIVWVIKYLLNCTISTTRCSHSIAAFWRNTEPFVHLNVFLCDCTLVSFGQLAKTFYVRPHNHSPWWGHSNYWNILLRGTYDFLGLNLYTAFMGKKWSWRVVPVAGQRHAHDPITRSELDRVCFFMAQSRYSCVLLCTSSYLLIYFFSLNLSSFH